MQKISSLWGRLRWSLALTGLIVLLSPPAVPGASTAAEDQWPGWLGPQRNGHSLDTGLLKQWPAQGPKLLWKVDCLGAGWSSVAVVDGRIYTTGNVQDDQMLFCFDLQGQPQWKVNVGPKCEHKKYPGTRATPVLDGNRIYLTSGNGPVTCHDKADGHVLWQRNMKEMGGKVGGWFYGESVLILGDLAIVTPGGSHAIVALDKTTGKDVWKADVSATAGYSSCIPIEDQGSTIIVNGSQSGLMAVDAKSGAKIWTNDFASPNTANVPTPAYADGYLFWAVGYGKGGICLKVKHSGGQWSFEPAWSNKELNCHPGNYVVAGGRIYGKSKAGLACLDLQTGKKLWAERSIGAGEVCWADGMLYSFADSGGRAFLVEPADAAPKVAGKVQVAGEGASWAYPVVTGGRLYLRYDTNLYCFDVQAK